MDIRKGLLRHYLFVAAVNQGLMSREIEDALSRYDRATFSRLIEARIAYLKSESGSDTVFFSPEYYSDGIEVMSEALENLDRILSKAD